MTKHYKKPYRIKKRTSVLRSRFFLTGILALAAIGGISYFLFFSGIFQIKKFIITGDKIISEENIQKFITQRNIFLIDTGKIEKDILNGFSQIAKVKINRGLPDALNILVTERLPIAVWCEGAKCFLTDQEGVIFGESPSETDLIKITGARKMIDKEKISQVVEIKGKLAGDLGITTTEAFIATEERLNIKTAEGWEIYFNLKGDLNWQLQELVLVLEKQISKDMRKKLEYVDLRFSRVYYK